MILNFDDVDVFWTHVRKNFEYAHPAMHDAVHLPIGLSGDDAKYTLAGAKIIVLMLNLILQDVESPLTV